MGKESIKMTNRPIKRCLTPPVIRELQFKTTMRCCFIPVRMTVIKNQKITDVGVDEVVVHLLSCVQPFAAPCPAARKASLAFTISQSLLTLMSIESVMPSKHLILCCPLLLLSQLFPSIRFFSNESVLHIRWPKYLSFSISPFKEYSGLISLRIDWLDLFAVQGIFKSLSRDLEESSLSPQFESISSSVFSLLYGQTVTSVHGG